MNEKQNELLELWLDIALVSHDVAEIRLRNRHNLMLADNYPKIGQFSAQETYKLFDLHHFLRHSSAFVEQQEHIANLGVFICQHIFGVSISDHLFNNRSPRILHIETSVGHQDRVLVELAQRFVRIPWEIARQTKDGYTLSQHNINVLHRHTPPNWHAQALNFDPQRPLRVLFVFAEEQTTLPIAARQERWAITQFFTDHIFPIKNIEAHFLPQTTKRGLIKQIREHSGYHILHWSAYSANQTLILGTENGQREYLGPTELISIFGEAGAALPCLVYLSDSYPRMHLQTFETHSVTAVDTVTHAENKQTKQFDFCEHAQNLHQAGVPSVLAMRYPVSDDYARQLALDFYAGLWTFDPVLTIANSLRIARNKLQSLKAHENSTEFAASDHAAPFFYGVDQDFLLEKNRRSSFSHLENKWLGAYDTGLQDLKVVPHFVGRKMQLEALASHWLSREGQYPIAQILGSQGIGKSALAAEAIDLCQRNFKWIIPFRLNPNAFAIESFFKEMHQRLQDEEGEYWQRVNCNQASRIYFPIQEDIQRSQREHRLFDNLVTALKAEAILLVFDHFQTLLKSPESETNPQCQCRDPAWDMLLSKLAIALRSTRSRVLITSRSPLASLEQNALTLSLGPIPSNEASLFERVNPSLRALLQGNEENRSLAKKMIRVSRFHPWLLTQLTEMLSAKESTAQEVIQPKLRSNETPDIELPQVLEKLEGLLKFVGLDTESVVSFDKATEKRREGIYFMDAIKLITQVRKIEEPKVHVANQANWESVASYTQATKDLKVTNADSHAFRVDDKRSNKLEHLLAQYIDCEKRLHATIRLPLVTANGQVVEANMEELRINLPLLSIFRPNNERGVSKTNETSPWDGQDGEVLHEQWRSTHTDSLEVDRAAHNKNGDVFSSSTLPQSCVVEQKLLTGKRVVLLGDPGSGKSTLLQWIAHHYASSFSLFGATAQPYDTSLPIFPWLPINILCRDLLRAPIPTSVEALLSAHIGLRQFNSDTAFQLVQFLQDLMQQGRIILLIDGLDEIPKSENRRNFCRLLNAIGQRYREMPIVISSRVVGFQVVKEELLQYEHLLVSPLNKEAKEGFIVRWAKHIGLRKNQASSLMQHVCTDRTTAKLTDTMILLALTVQIHVSDQQLPERRVDIFRRTVELMLTRRSSSLKLELSKNELLPHLEYLAYWMRSKGLQRCNENEIITAFTQLRQQAPDHEQGQLCARKPSELLNACMETVGVLNVAGLSIDNKGNEWKEVQFFHQSFQEYFAGQAVKHGWAGAKNSDVLQRLRDLLSKMEMKERSFTIFGQYQFSESVLAEHWQEAIRLMIADLLPEQADEALMMLVPCDLSQKNARPSIVFALQCLIDGPKVSNSTIKTIFKAALAVFNDADGFNTERNTRMDEALASIAASQYWPLMRQQLVQGYIESRDEQRLYIGRCLAQHCSNAGALNLENVETLINSVLPQLKSARPFERVAAAILVMNRCYASGGKLGFLTQPQKEKIAQALLACLQNDEATVAAALWALVWFTGARLRSNDVNSTPEASIVSLGKQACARIALCINDTKLDFNAQLNACLLLCREHGIGTLIRQQDWIYNLAVIADGDKKRAQLAQARQSGWRGDAQALHALLGRKPPDIMAGQIAASMGALGILSPEMVGPLRHRFFDARNAGNDRDEAMIYLALIASPEAVKTLIFAADSVPPSEKDSYLYTRGLFGLLLVGNINVLIGQIKKAAPHDDLKAYAFCIAGSGNPHATAVLKELAMDSNERVRLAAYAALQHKFLGEPAKSQNNSGFFGWVKKLFE